MWRWLLQVESMGRSLSIYSLFVAADKFLTFLRVVLLTWLIGTEQFGLWSLGVMVFSTLAPVATLGSSESLARYVSFYQARGRLEQFVRRSAVAVGLIALATLLAGLAASGRIAGLLASSEGAGASPHALLQVAQLGVVNGVLMALYLNLQSCIRAMRTFRLLAAVDLGYSALFTVSTLAAMVWWPEGRAVLICHAGALATMLLAGGYAAARAVRGRQAPPPGSPTILPGDELGTVVPDSPASAVPAAVSASPAGGWGVMGRLAAFGIVSMFATLLWQLGNQVSAWFVNRQLGPGPMGIYAAFRQLCQPVWILAGILWGLVFSHVANHWESHRRTEALRMLNLTYKVVVLALMSLSVAALTTARWWSLLLSGAYRAEPAVLAGLVMFFQASANLGLASMAAKLRERPGVIVAMVALAVAVNTVLAGRWVGSGGLAGAAQAAGAGMLSACVLGAGWLVAARFQAGWSALALSVCPALLLLPPPWAAAAWVAVLVLTALGPWVLSAWEKRTLLEYVGGLLRRPAGR